MKPKGNSDNEIGFLEYLEEIIGSIQYKAELNQLEESYDGLLD